MEFSDYLDALRRRWLSSLIIVVVCVAAAILVTQLSERVYAAESRAFVSFTSDPEAAGATGMLSASQFTLQRVRSYVELSDSSLVLQPVIDELALEMSPAELAGHVRIDNPTQTVVLNVVATNSSARRAAEISNAIMARLAALVADLEGAGGPPPVEVVVTKDATPPSVPISPRPTLNIGLGIVGGCALALGQAVAREHLSRSGRQAHKAGPTTGT